jgi:hypothetical protein
MNPDHRTLLENYVTPNLPGSFAGFESFFRSLKERGVVVQEDKRRVKEWMKGNSTYTKHRYARRRFPTNKVIVNGIDDTWQMDLVDMCSYSRTNNGYNWILVCIDVFSKFVWIKLLKTKAANPVAVAFREIISDGRKPINLQCDEGTEFINTTFKRLCREQNINLYHVESDKKASIVERVLRTLKEKLWRVFTDRGQYIYHDIIDDIIQNYNNCYHRSIKCKPAEVNKRNEKIIWETMYGKVYNQVISFKFNVGDLVRFREFKDMRFDKGYVENYSEEVFTVIERVPRVPPVYRIREENGREMDSFYYEQELLAINRDPDPFYLIERILERRGNRVLVKWLGYPDYYNQWINENEVINLAR